MNMKKSIIRTIILATSIATAQMNAMMGSYLATLAGDAVLLATGCSATVKQELNVEIQARLVSERFFTLSQISQIKTDVNRIEQYLPILLPVAVVLSIGGRLGMISKAIIRGGLLASASAPINLTLIGGAYCMRLDQTPDAGIVAKTGDTALNMLKRLSNPKTK
jgi:hypothetical protein